MLVTSIHVVGETDGGPRSESPLIDVEAMSDEAPSPRPPTPPREGQSAASEATTVD